MSEDGGSTRGAQDGAQQRLSTEGADLLTLAGVNDANLVELARIGGVKVALRGEAMMLSGPADAVARAAGIGQRMIDMARQGIPLTPDDVLRVSLDQGGSRDDGDGAAAPIPGTGGEGRLALPGVRRLIQAKTSGQSEYMKKIAENDIVIGIGPAGTGKTFLAVAMAVDALVRKRVRKIVLARPAVEAGESLGFLPGDMQAKVDPYLRPLYDALDEMMPPERVAKALETRTIEIAPLAFMRGRTLGDAFVILDEAQNATNLQMKMFLTRLGVNSKIVITGDKTQIDLPRREDSGLMQVERILHEIEGISFHYFTDADVVRHRLVRDIIKAYAEDAGD
ncbi:PhoH family protein [Roseisolibacter agri]|uniref:PhoH-like protein n=1 Tax=Roseisolibacter agri TaxID=2014610 RepID=A0AA37VFS0_9BACT|nr:PhoH family protein [Roseisolibacter agri]GLC27329.1 phosphate starvation protein PhoH [Roseisolibacter agri]